MCMIGKVLFTFDWWLKIEMLSKNRQKAPHYAK